MLKPLFTGLLTRGILRRVSYTPNSYSSSIRIVSSFGCLCHGPKDVDGYTLLAIFVKVFVKVAARTFWGKGNRAMAKVIERVEACYEVEEVEMGKVYRWCPESIVIECEECGEKTSLTASNNNCVECGADYRDFVEEEVLEARPEGKLYHPWRSPRPYYTPTSGA
jgi:hypothetical protein